jgi:hypothetical protein
MGYSNVLLSNIPISSYSVSRKIYRLISVIVSLSLPLYRPTCCLTSGLQLVIVVLFIVLVIILPNRLANTRTDLHYHHPPVFRYHEVGSKKLNACIRFFLCVVYFEPKHKAMLFADNT